MGYFYYQVLVPKERAKEANEAIEKAHCLYNRGVYPDPDKAVRECLEDAIGGVPYDITKMWYG